MQKLKQGYHIVRCVTQTLQGGTNPPIHVLVNWLIGVQNKLSHESGPTTAAALSGLIIASIVQAAIVMLLLGTLVMMVYTYSTLLLFPALHGYLSTKRFPKTTPASCSLLNAQLEDQRTPSKLINKRARKSLSLILSHDRRASFCVVVHGSQLETQQDRSEGMTAEGHLPALHRWSRFALTNLGA